MRSHLYVVEANGSVEVSEFTESRLSLANKGRLPVRVIFGGAHPNGTCHATITGHGRTETESMRATSSGQASLILMEGKAVSFTADRPVAVK
jgi:hypothetical protein